MLRYKTRMLHTCVQGADVSRSAAPGNRAAVPITKIRNSNSALRIVTDR